MSKIPPVTPDDLKLDLERSFELGWQDWDEETIIGFIRLAAHEQAERDRYKAEAKELKRAPTFYAREANKRGERITILEAALREIIRVYDPKTHQHVADIARRALTQTEDPDTEETPDDCKDCPGCARCAPYESNQP